LPRPCSMLPDLDCALLTRVLRVLCDTWAADLLFQASGGIAAVYYGRGLWPQGADSLIRVIRVVRSRRGEEAENPAGWSVNPPPYGRVAQIGRAGRCVDRRLVVFAFPGQIHRFRTVREGPRALPLASATRPYLGGYGFQSVVRSDFREIPWPSVVNRRPSFRVFRLFRGTHRRSAPSVVPPDVPVFRPLRGGHPPFFRGVTAGKAFWMWPLRASSLAVIRR
jgi:hypothetical protein